MALPIDTVLPELLTALRAAPAAVLQAPPGAGKTTRVPLALLNEPWLGDKRIVMLEPRRLAARAAARFMAAKLGEAVGQTVGYRMRLDTKVSAATRIEVVTEGVLTRLLQDDPALSAYGCVIFDEFHERSLSADLGLALTLESQGALREDLRLVVMSATLDGEPIARLLGGAPLITSEGRSYPVEVRYAPPGRLPWEQQLVQVVARALKEEAGSLLVFLPGVGEIRRLQRLLEPHLPADTFLAPLYGELSQGSQDAAIAPAPAGKRKLVLATAIAETSLTIEGVRVVVDAGFMRRPEFDPVSGLTRLVTVRVSQAAAEQRRGRAGRLEPGVCYRLWGESEQARLAAFTVPEILEADLSDLVLELARWGALAPDALSWLDAPPQPAWEQARELLQRLQALDGQGRISDHGRRLHELPLHPRLAHMVIRADALGWGRMACELAALLSERDVLTGARHADVHARLAALRGESGEYPPDRARLGRVREGVRSLASRLQGRPQPELADTPGILLGFAYPERLAQRRPGKAPRFLLANGRGALLAEDDPLRQAPYLVAAELDGDPREARVFLAAQISRDTIEEHFGAGIEAGEFVRWDDASDAVQARRQRRYGALVLEDKPLDKVPAEAVAAGLMEGLRRKGLAGLPWSEPIRQWQARVALMRRLEGEAWPALDEPALLARLENWFVPYAGGYSRLSQLKDFPLRQALESLLSYEQQRALEAAAPTHYAVPSGSRIAIDYLSEPPVLAVKLQEMFGEQGSPSVGHGRVPLTLHLLSPAQRPVQVTQDLAGFWRSGYAEVRKELRGRYPRHPWPEDPLTAVATRRAKPRQ
jgi:ATP-dependent helicase HrpB